MSALHTQFEHAEFAKPLNWFELSMGKLRAAKGARAAEQLRFRTSRFEFQHASALGNADWSGCCGT